MSYSGRRGVGVKRVGLSLTAVTSAAFPKCLWKLISLSNKMGRAAGHRFHIVLAEEAGPHASLISDYDCGVFNSSCTAISQPRGGRIIVFSEWMSANTAPLCSGPLSFSRGLQGAGGEKLFCHWVSIGTGKSTKQGHCNLTLWCALASQALKLSPTSSLGLGSKDPFFSFNNDVSMNLWWGKSKCVLLG